MALRVLVVGSGVAGSAFCKAASTHERRYALDVIDKGSRIGGRMTSWKSKAEETAGFVADGSAQIIDLSESSAEFIDKHAQVTTFDSGRGSRTSFVSSPDVASLPTAFVQQSQSIIKRHVQGKRVVRLDSNNAAQWSATLDDGSCIDADVAVLSMPAPQLLPTGVFGLAGDVTSRLGEAGLVTPINNVQYEGCITMVLWAKQQYIDAVLPTGYASLSAASGGYLSSVSNEYRRRAPAGSASSSSPSDACGALVVHSGPGLLQGEPWIMAEKNFPRERAQTAMLELLLEALPSSSSLVTGRGVIDVKVHRWRYANVTRPIDLPAEHRARTSDAPCAYLPATDRYAPLLLCGDYFPSSDGGDDSVRGGVDRAVRSGRAAAEVLARESPPTA